MWLYSDYSLENLFSLEGQVVLVTGAGGQLGGEIVSSCLALGAEIVAADLSEEGLKLKASELGWPSEKVLLNQCDISKKKDVRELFKSGIEAFGYISSLVNNAGTSVFSPFLDRTEEELDFVMDVNLKGTFWCIREFVEKFKAETLGQIVNISSHYGLVSPDPRIYTDCLRRNSEIYGATKAGVIQMTRYFAIHLAAQNIRVNGVAPGGVRNPMDPQGDNFQSNYGFRTPLGRMAEVNEIPGAVIFLLSKASSYVNGHTITVDGGMSAW